jgi:hypothetical protein
MPAMSSDLAMGYALDSKVKPPGIALMIAGGFNALLTLGGASIYLLIFGFAAIAPSNTSSGGPKQDETIGLVVLISVIVIFAAIALVLYGLIIFGGWNLMNRRSYAFALTGIILSFIAGVPCSCIPINTLIFVPIGIWSLITLLDAGVKDSFQS